MTDRTAAATGSLLGGYRGRLLVSLSVAWSGIQLGRYILSPLLPRIIESLAITSATAGLGLALFQLVYAVTQFPSGRVSDAHGRPALVVAGLALLTVSFLLLGAAVGVVTFGLALLVLGVGKGLFAIPSRAQLSDVYGDQRGRALGVYTAGTDLGGLLASGLAVVALAVATWRAPFLPIAAALAVTGVGYVAWNRDAYAVGRTDLELRATVRRLAATRAQREVLVAFGLFYFVVGGIVNFLPAFLERTKDVDPAVASGLFALVFAVGIPVKPVAGSLSDRFSRRGIAVVGLVLAAAAMGLLVAASSLLAVGAAIVLLAAGYKTQFPLADAVVMDAAPDANVGAALGAARAVFLGVGALGPAYVGVVADVASYDVAFLGLGVTLLGCAGLLGYRRALSVARTR